MIITRNINISHAKEVFDTKENFSFVDLTEEQANKLWYAADQCMYILDTALGYIIETKKLSALGIPEYLHEVITYTYKNYETHPYMLGRFDFSFTESEIKLIEFNADTPFTLPETYLQYAILEKEGMDPDSHQYNTIYEELRTYYDKLISLRKNKFLFSAVNHDEDFNNLFILMNSLIETDIYDHTEYTNLCCDENSIFNYENPEFSANALIKMMPFDIMTTDDVPVIKELARLVLEDKNVTCNPFYALAYQSKALLKFAYDMFPESQYLLKTTFSKNDFTSEYVKKPFYGREGQNIELFSKNYFSTSGQYGNNNSVYQDLAKFDTDSEGNYYQAGYFISGYSPCCINFRRSKSLIMDGSSEVCGHYIVG